MCIRDRINNESKLVVADVDDFQAHSIVIVMCLEHYEGLSHHDAVMKYSAATKTLREDSLSMDNISVADYLMNFDESVDKYDLLITPPDFPAIDFWKV